MIRSRFVLATLLLNVQAQVRLPECAYNCYYTARSTLGCLGGPFPTYCICTPGFSQTHYAPCVTSNCASTDYTWADQYYTSALCPTIVPVATSTALGTAFRPTSSSPISTLPTLIPLTSGEQATLVVTMSITSLQTQTAAIGTVFTPSSAGLGSSSSAILGGSHAGFSGFTSSPQSTSGSSSSTTNGSSNDNGRIIGIGAGVGIGSAVTILVVGILWYRRKHKKRSNVSELMVEPQLGPHIHAPPQPYDPTPPHAYERPNKQEVIEQTYPEPRR